MPSVGAPDARRAGTIVMVSILANMAQMVIANISRTQPMTEGPMAEINRLANMSNIAIKGSGYGAHPAPPPDPRNLWLGGQETTLRDKMMNFRDDEFVWGWDFVQEF